MKLRDLWPFSGKSVTVADLPQEILSLGVSKSGQSVNVTTALKVSTVFACVRVIAEGVAQVPLKVFLEDGRDRNPAKDHPLYDLLHRQPNDIATSFAFRETLVLHAALTGKGFAFVNRGAGGKILELVNIDPGAVTVLTSDVMGERPIYRVQGKNGSKRDFPAESIFVLNGPSWDGITGMDILKMAREAVGLAMATEVAHSKMHSNGARPGGLLSVDGTLNPDQYKTLRKWIDENHTGTENAWKTMIMDKAAKFTQMGMTGVDAQHLETRKHQIEEVCRYFRMMPIMIGYSDKAATYASAEQMFLAHVVHCLSPWYERIEQAMDCQLLTKAERQAGHYIKFVIAGLLRGALKDTAEYLYKLVSIGIMTRNEARDKLELNPLADMDKPLTPINLTDSPDAGGSKDA